MLCMLCCAVLPAGRASMISTTRSGNPSAASECWDAWMPKHIDSHNCCYFRRKFCGRWRGSLETKTWQGRVAGGCCAPTAASGRVGPAALFLAALRQRAWGIAQPQGGQPGEERKEEIALEVCPSATWHLLLLAPLDTPAHPSRKRTHSQPLPLRAGQRI